MNLRAFKAIFRQTFSRKGSGGAKATNTVFIMCLIFVFALCCVAVNLMLSGFISRYTAYQGNTKAVVVNMPTSVRIYLEENDTFLLDQIVSVKHDTEFDVTYFSREMRENNAFIAIVFPEDFDEAVREQRQPEILYFLLTDKLKYVSWADTIEDEPLWFYEQAMRREMDIPLADNDNSFISISAVKTTEEMSDAQYLADFFATMMIPLVTFIGALYICMSKGTNSISWQKENGVFTGILMTPIRPATIVTGNLAGIWLSALLPGLIIYPLLFLIPFYRSISGPFIVFLYLITLTLFISSVTLMISIMNDTVVSAQTAFLPVFFILISVCVMCIQGVGAAPEFYYAIPVYGHFYGIGSALMGDPIHIPSLLLCLISTSLISGICIFTSVKLLYNERFTATVESFSDKEARKLMRKMQKQSSDYLIKPKASIFGYVPKKRKDAPSFILGQIFFPLAVLSLFQTLAMIPALIHLSKSPDFSSIISSLNGISTVGEVVVRTFEFFGLLMTKPVFIFCMVLGYIGIISVYILKVRFREKNSTATIGFNGKISLRNYGTGLLIGFGMISAVYLLLTLTGNVKITGFGVPSDMLLLFIADMLMWIPQGASEEIMFRGYMIPRVAARFGTPFAVFFSSLMFGIFHAANIGFTVLALINLILIASAFALIALYRGEIYTVCGAHTIWNFCQGNIYGLEVSGNASGASLIRSFYPQSAPDFITGGSFGPEGGIFVTAVSITVIIIMIFLLRKKHSAAVTGDSTLKG